MRCFALAARRFLSVSGRIRMVIGMAFNVLGEKTRLCPSTASSRAMMRGRLG